MCEIYGAFGWAKGIPTMKYFTDFMLVGGVNHFVPHAFSAKTEDPDCPPHFYNAESEWCGGKYMQLPDIASKLGRAHVEFDFVPMDYLMEADAICEKLHVRQCEYKVLLIPGAEILPQALLKSIRLLWKLL